MNTQPDPNHLTSSRRPKVLLVDEPSAKLSSLRSRLLQFGFETAQATNAADALDRAIAWHPDLILLEIRLAGTDGLDLFQQMYRNASTPILIVSAEVDEHLLVHYLDAGAIGYLRKSSSVVELGARVRACLRRLSLPKIDISGMPCAT